MGDGLGFGGWSSGGMDDGMSNDWMGMNNDYQTVDVLPIDPYDERFYPDNLLEMPITPFDPPSPLDLTPPQQPPLDIVPTTRTIDA
jgi:hypothetical protein